jgi:hypothetical protein
MIKRRYRTTAVKIIFRKKSCNKRAIQLHKNNRTIVAAKHSAYTKMVAAQ